MPNTILTPSIIAKEALMVLRNNAVMANLVYRDYSAEFNGKVGDTITVRKPAKFVAKEFNGETETQDITESGVPIVMNKLLDVTFAVSAKELALSIEDFSKQLLVPAMQAFADKVDGYLLALEEDITNRVAHSSGSIGKGDIVSTRKFLTDAAAPSANRNFVYGSQAEADLLNTDLFINASAVGDNGTALREASLGRKFGLDFYVDQNVKTKTIGEGAEEKTYTPSIAFHKNAFALVTRTLPIPMGTKDSAIENYDGFALRVVYGYDQNKKENTISIDMLCGVKTLDKNLAAVLEDTRTP